LDFAQQIVVLFWDPFETGLIFGKLREDPLAFSLAPPFALSRRNYGGGSGKDATANLSNTPDDSCMSSKRLYQRRQRRAK
jgi:hypothetical protein